MKKKKVQVELPLSICYLLEEIAAASGWTMQEVMAQTVKAGLPPSLGKVPEDFHDDLLALNKMGDRDLLRVIEGELELSGQRSADFKLLRKTYALRLLKWRGHPVPPPFEALVS